MGGYEFRRIGSLPPYVFAATCESIRKTLVELG